LRLCTSPSTVESQRNRRRGHGSDPDAKICIPLPDAIRRRVVNVIGLIPEGQRGRGTQGDVSGTSHGTSQPLLSPASGGGHCLDRLTIGAPAPLLKSVLMLFHKTIPCRPEHLCGGNCCCTGEVCQSWGNILDYGAPPLLHSSL
jgi:hypothetical protein